MWGINQIVIKFWSDLGRNEGFVAMKEGQS